ncbi:MAG TPA: hypothetical protein VG407_10465 [Caulobacteraceae bacterium]|jgi:hypothetical protein|nr:hypothetical protein [Caulobacteraceae bacterium]
MSRCYADDEAIRRLGDRVLACDLPKIEWTHAAHFAVALWILRERAEIVPERDMGAIIRAYNERTNTPNTDTSGYHETITQASLRAARAHMASRPADEPLHLVVDALMAEMLGRSDWPMWFWSKPVLFSVEARREWVEPDLKPLPW